MMWHSACLQNMCQIGSFPKQTFWNWPPRLTYDTRFSYLRCWVDSWFNSGQRDVLTMQEHPATKKVIDKWLVCKSCEHLFGLHLAFSKHDWIHLTPVWGSACCDYRTCLLYGSKACDNEILLPNMLTCLKGIWSFSALGCDMKWDEVTWTEMKWDEMTWTEIKRAESFGHSPTSVFSENVCSKKKATPKLLNFGLVVADISPNSSKNSCSQSVADLVLEKKWNSCFTIPVLAFIEQKMGKFQ